ncbi:aminoglycoside 3-N-acetyltransferase [Ramlibacter ginsenosidimutans]|uniref:Aminoglycoside N(3)-acetyltransferase n=1 Tax=Ramlibacter ginsenosidimutans TaxID=502333 RepID=A0A934WMK6_9BURK|nr:aminoglycoside 3-N-acetyltransferase [Ramlibacter ginsenosidimutans]MBK6006603.1 aminoglycoside 3-N-acetyltransferase [Ramlibacter ginsenosidimutans]
MLFNPLDRGQLVTQLHDIGLHAGDLVMVHTSLRAIGAIAGGPQTLLDALLEVLGAHGTLAAYVSWKHSSYDATLDGRTLSARERARWPLFDPSAAAPHEGFGYFNQFVCRHPAVHRSAHPTANIAAIGCRAAELTADHSLLDGYAPGSPLGRIVAAPGRVLMLGAPPGSLTVLHLAQAIARIPGKRRVRYEVPLLIDGERCWRQAEEFDTNGLLDQFVDNGFDDIAAIATDYVLEERGRRGRVGRANCWLFDAQDLVSFGVSWLERRFG